jgi:hypothetical protein
LDYKRLLTQVERTLEQIDTGDSPTTTVAQIAETIAANFRVELGITGGRVYELRDEGGYELVARFGEVTQGQLGIEVPREYKPIELAIENGIVVMDIRAIRAWIRCSRRSWGRSASVRSR